jgi:hypothetical protein
METCFLITTYNRQESCQRLVDSLQGMGDIIVVGDCVDYTISGCTFRNLSQHLGREMYWLTVKLLFSLRGQHKYYFMLPDDFMLRPEKAEEALRLWTEIDDPQKICLNLYADRIGLSCWTRFKPIDRGNVWQTGWVDMCFLAEGRFFEQLDLSKVRCTKSHSSGVGAYISNTLYGHGFHLYQVKDSLVELQMEHGFSQMHNKENNDIRRFSNNPKQKRVFDSRGGEYRKPG